jgi:hypothetical protein
MTRLARHSMSARTRTGQGEVLEGNGRFSRKRWLAIIAVPTLVAFGYLWVILWFAAHQRDFQYTPGGSRVAPETVGLDGFAAVEIRPRTVNGSSPGGRFRLRAAALICSCTALRQRCRIPSGGCPISGRAGSG